MLRQEALAMHAAVQHQPDSERRGRLRFFQHAQLLFALHHQPQPVALDLGQLGRLEHALQQQNGRAHAGGAQLQRFLQTGYGETVGYIGQRLGATRRVVAVAIGLQHRQYPPAMLTLSQQVVVAQVLGANGGDQRPHAQAPATAGRAAGTTRVSPCLA